MTKYTSAMMSARGQRGTTTPYVPGYRMKNKQKKSLRKGKKKWTGWKPKTDEQKHEFRKNVMEKYDDKVDEDLATMQKSVEIAACKVAHNTKAERANLYKRKLLQDVRKRSREETGLESKG